MSKRSYYTERYEDGLIINTMHKTITKVIVTIDDGINKFKKIITPETKDIDLGLPKYYNNKEEGFNSMWFYRFTENGTMYEIKFINDGPCSGHSYEIFVDVDSIETAYHLSGDEFSVKEFYTEEEYTEDEIYVNYED